MARSSYPNWHQNRFKTAPFYLITLEAWRRGLAVTFTQDIKNYEIRSPLRSLKFSKSLLLDPEWGLRTHEICENKDTAKQYMSKAGVPVPRGRQFRLSDSREDILAQAAELGYPVVLKPVSGYKGKGVFPEIPDEASLVRALNHLRHELGYRDLLLEEHVAGDDHRIFVLAGKAFAALRRVPANVIGNGRDTIRKLIDEKNRARQKNPHTGEKLIRFDRDATDNLRRKGYTFDSVPAEGEMIFLQKKSNVSYGGDFIDVTDSLPAHVKQTAVRAVKAIPGLHHGGVDVLYDSRDPQGLAVVIEINSMAEFGGHLYPVQGTPRDVAAAIIDACFPESMEMQGRNGSLFYDVIRLHATLEAAPDAPVTLPHPPEFELYCREILVSGRVQGVGFRRWAFSEAERLGISGYATNSEDGRVRLFAAGRAEDVAEFEMLCRRGPTGARVERITSEPADQPVIMGFIIVRRGGAASVTAGNWYKVLIQKGRKTAKKLLGSLRLMGLMQHLNKKNDKNRSA